MTDSFGSRDVLRVGGREYAYHRLEALERHSVSLARLPYALRILLENLLRHEDGRVVTAEDVLALAGWDPVAVPSREIAFTPARVLLQDFTGVPAVVDLAAMREAMARLGGDPARINPLQPVELVIDHSVQVDRFGSAGALEFNSAMEFRRNEERYAFLRWGQRAFRNFKVVPPATGIVHQVNLEFLARVVFAEGAEGGPLPGMAGPDGRADGGGGSSGERPLAFPDTLVGTDSHTTMINSLGVLAWGVGGIEAEAAMLGQPISMLIPQVVGFRLEGELPEGATATDLVLTVTERLRQRGVVGKLVEFYGPGLTSLPIADRATIANMAPEYGATCGIFPVDAETLRYLRFTGRPAELVDLVEAYTKEQGLFHTPDSPDASYSGTLELDLGTVEPSLAGPKRPQDRVRLSEAGRAFGEALQAMLAGDRSRAVGSVQAAARAPGSASSAAGPALPGGGSRASDGTGNGDGRRGLVTEASEESFPASDAPGWTTGLEPAVGKSPMLETSETPSGGDMGAGAAGRAGDEGFGAPATKAGAGGVRAPATETAIAGVRASAAEDAQGVPVTLDGERFELSHGSIVIAAITSCTNTSNPSVMVAAGLVAKKAVERGLRAKPWVKTSLAPGSKVVTEYLAAAGLTPYLEQLGFHVVGYGCTTCIGNSGPLPAEITGAIDEGGLVAVSVLSGNRNFEGRINSEVRANYLASPPLVVAYALAGRMDVDILEEPLGHGRDGRPVYLRDVWPTNIEVQRVVEASVRSEMFRAKYASVFEGDERWRSLPTPESDVYQWDPASNYIRNPPYFEGMTLEPRPVEDLRGLRVLAMLGDSVTTDHISPAGSFKADSPAGRHLVERGVAPKDFNSYGSRRGNHEVLMRGTFANVRLRNRLAPGTEGGFTRHLPDGETTTIFEAARRYVQEGVPLLVIAGKEYGTGSSRDWAAKGPLLLGVRAVIAESYERIHRSNLIGMGLAPLQFLDGENATVLGLTGEEEFSIEGLAEAIAAIEGGRDEGVAGMGSGGDSGRSEGRRPAGGNPHEVTVRGRSSHRLPFEFRALLRVDTPNEATYYRHGGILQFVLRSLLKSRATSP